MKNRFLFPVLAGLFLLGIFFLSSLFSLSSFSSLLGNPLNSSEPRSEPVYLVQDQGEVRVHFCPIEDCEKILLDSLNSAQQYLHCAFYDIGLSSVQEKLLKQKDKIEVLILTDDHYLKKFNYSFVKSDSSFGLMHNKFCVIDGERILTGSMNPTEGDAHQNYNNLLLITSPRLAQIYEQKFLQLWEKQAKKSSLENQGIILGNTSLQVYFCPEDHCAEEVIEEIKQAKISVHFMVFSFTHSSIAQELLLHKLSQIEVKGIMDKQQAGGEYSVYPLLQYQGVPVLLENHKGLLHHKVFIIDGETIITGSFNPTKSGNERNAENMLIIRDQNIAKQFVTEFNRLWEENNGSAN